MVVWNNRHVAVQNKSYTLENLNIADYQISAIFCKSLFLVTQLEMFFAILREWLIKHFFLLIKHIRQKAIIVRSVFTLFPKQILLYFVLRIYDYIVEYFVFVMSVCPLFTSVAEYILLMMMYDLKPLSVYSLNSTWFISVI